ncbi:MAG: homoserine O-succinyltransferase [Anaerotignum sp.]|nr:homoserine O-succinyltransferase [Anaerotignum sp.]
MPIKIPNNLPAAEILLKENIFVMTENRAMTQDIRPLRILLLNLMPTKIDTETQLSRLLGNTPLQIELELIHTKSHESKNTPEDHMISFYKTFDDVKDQNWDGLIITGAPVELMPFEEVEYWDELVEIMEWSKTNVHSTFHICWGAQAGLYYHYGINKRIMDEKMFGVFPHVLEKKKSILFRGSDDIFYVPHSRHTTVDRELIEKDPRLKIIASSDEAGVYAIHTDGGKQVFIMGHSEYDPRTLEKEYLRDKNAGLEIAVPKNYYPNDDDTKDPLVTWRAHANLLYSNWLNYFVYQTSPYDITRISNENVAYPEPIKLD